MAATADTLLPPAVVAGRRPGLMAWAQGHRGAVVLAGWLAFSAPVTFFAGDLGVMHQPSPWVVIELASWWLLFGLQLWLLLLVGGHACLFRMPPLPRYGRAVLWLLSACVVVATVNLTTTPRAEILVDQGIAPSVLTAQLHGFAFALVMALLFYEHLRRQRRHDAAATRLAAAQAAQRSAHQRSVQGRLAALQARVEPQLLFDMLDAVRRLYTSDAARAEHLLDGLIAFIRAALPRLREASSSVAREAELARAFTRLHALADASDSEMGLDIGGEALHARFPPGVLLPLLAEVPFGCGPRTLAALCSAEHCRVVLTLPAAPPSEVLARVRSLLADLYGAQASLAVASEHGRTTVSVQVPYEHA